MAGTKKTREQLLKAAEKTRKALEALDVEEGVTTPTKKVPTAAPTPEADPLEARRTAEDFQLIPSADNVIFSPNHVLMAKPQRNERDPRKLQRFFFYKRLTDDKVFCWTEAEADLMLKSSHKVILRLIGVSNGTAYSKSIQNCGVKIGQVIPVKRAQEILNAAYEAELESARGNFDDPDPQNVHFDDTVRRHRNAKSIIQGFNPS
jgi:hypothetical protein